MTSFRRYGIASAVVFFAALLGESTSFADDPIDRPIEHYPGAMSVRECLKELTDVTGAKFELVDPSDGDLTMETSPYVGNEDGKEPKPLTLRNTLTRYLAYVELTCKQENGVIRVFPTKPFQAHKEAAKRLAVKGAKVEIAYPWRGLGVQVGYERGWWTHLEFASKWTGSAEDFGLISQLLRVQYVKLQGAKLAPGSLAALVSAKPNNLAIIDCKLERADFESIGKLKLAVLRLDKVQLLKSDVEHISRLATLTELSLAHSRVMPGDLAPLQKLTELRELRLEGVPITDRELAYLKDMKGMYYLSLAGTRITDAGLEHLKGMQWLSVLDIDKTEIGDRGAARIAEQFRHLEALRCGWTCMTDQGSKSLARLRRLLTLSLERNYVTNASLNELVKLSGGHMTLPQPAIFLRDTLVTDETKETLENWIAVVKKPIGDGFPKQIHIGGGNPAPDPPWTGEHVPGPPTDLELLQGKWRLKAKIERAADGSDRQSTPGNYLSFREITGRVISTLAEPLPGQKQLNSAPVRNHLVSLESGDPKKARLMPIAGGDIQDSKGLPIAYTLEGDTLTIYFSADATTTPNPKQMKPGDRKEIFERVKVQEKPVAPPQE